MTTSLPRAARAASVAALAAVAVGALASCSSGSADGASDAGTGAAGTAAASTASGTWKQSGDYTTPGGQESVTVELTAKDGTVTAVQVTGSGGSPNARQYQEAFASGISAAVVGKPLSTLEVGAVSGSSLTGNGFNAAVDKIRADAA